MRASTHWGRRLDAAHAKINGQMRYLWRAVDHEGEMLNDAQSLSIPLFPVAPGRWTTVAGTEWSNPGGGLWGGYAIGLCIRVLEAEPEAVGEPLSLTLTYAAGLPAGALDIRTRRLRQGGSIGFWEVELLAAGSDHVGVHAILSVARRPKTPDFAFARMPAAPA